MYRLLRGVPTKTSCEQLERMSAHSPVGASRQAASAEKICWDFVHALLELAVWLQSGEDRAIAAGSQADK
jgi:hypothetical protein